MSLLVWIVLLGWGIAAARADDGPQPASGAGGMRMRAPDQAGLTAPAPTDAPSESDSTRARVAAELSEEGVDLPGGGVKINLRGNFRAAVTRRADSAGPTGHACTEQGPSANE